MLLDLEIPKIVPVMTLRETVFFPQAILPLYIFEPRYREMLDDVLRGDRLFAVACQDEARGDDEDEEHPCAMATVGVVRAAHANPDGTSNLVLQGMCRVRVLRVDDSGAYPRIEIEPVTTDLPAPDAPIARMKDQIGGLLRAEPDLANDVPTEFVGFLETLEDPDVYIDLTAFATCACALTKQRLLETLNLEHRYKTYLRYLARVRLKRDLHRKLQGGIGDEQIELN